MPDPAAAWHHYWRLPFGYRVKAQRLSRRTRWFVDVQIGIGRRFISVERT